MDIVKEVTQEEFFHFLELLSKLNPIEFLGVATYFEVPCFDDLERKHPRDTESLMSDLMDAFLLAPQRNRKYIMNQMKKAIQVRKK